MYTIIIKQLTREQSKERNWCIVGKDDEGEPVRDYRNEEKTVDVEREVYSQIVEDLDIVDVIAAVNAKGAKNV